MQAPRRVGTGTNQEAVRRHNLGTVLRHVHRAGQLSRAELTRRMGLNRSTIAALTAELETLGITERTGPATVSAGERQGAGRPSTGVRLAATGPYVIAVDLRVDHATVARVGLGGAIQQRAHASTAGLAEAWQVGAAVATLIRKVVTDASSSAPLVGIGIAVPGMVRRTDGLIRLAPNLEWHDVSFSSVVLAALGVDIPVMVANDANLGALAEHERGAGVGVDDLVYISGQVGVGAGIITGGHPLEGVGGYAGEIGHLRFDPTGPPCHCGSTGCWETAVGGPAIAAAIGSALEDVAQLPQHLRQLTEASPELRRIGGDIGRGLASIINAFNPQLVVLGGYFSDVHPLVRDEILDGLTCAALPAALDSVTLTVPSLGDDSVLLGAAEAALDPLLVDPVASIGTALLDVPARLAG
ncbi:Sugar kinase of the NBD/HSP70 family, may contain an N-terminal HTH domain [Nocardioides terrae]|uniref:Sugar kinase of the NBD/HSP70 family, may contain an N-terminal HTH domain n=1 Tax=Nocardioides terrae TaxID=574651 RepID=A0A1I1LJI5_9ACTN|nr:ROK family transcriptional regulator [Nocardioides terrae]SFC72732.1 Sugar kinase of the NBD/HSP70 family, may contain an N-terminal HTH domain [Nocardioides terrae]